ncbi:MAG TPA: DUF362 domain-containing protein [Bacillota bacterium]
MTGRLSDPVRWKTIEGPEDLRALLVEVGGLGDFFIVKPNWFDPRPGSYTDPYVLDLVLTALPGKKLVIEGHSHSRNDLSQRITPENMDDQREWIRRQEQLYLDRTGLAEVLSRHAVEYLNITEEYWAGRVAAASTVRDLVESRYGPLTHQEFYGYVPKRLFDLRGATLIDLARMKISSPTSRDYSLTMKNLFGLIPHVSRYSYHDSLSESIIDINLVYRTLFDVVGVGEGIRQAVFFWDKGRFVTPWSRFDVVKDLGMAVAGRDLAAVDTVVGMMFGQNLTMRTAIKLAEEKFGELDPEALGEPPLLVDVRDEDWIGPLEAQGRIVSEPA